MTCLTLATWSGFWCSTPPWRRKPHGAPPDNVIITSSATIVSLSLSFLAFLLFLGYIQLLFGLFISSLGALSALAPCSAIRAPLESFDVLFACHTVRALTSLWLKLHGRHSHLNTHTCMHTVLSPHPHPEWVSHHREAKVEREREKEREIWGDVVLCLLTLRNAGPNEWGEGPTQHLSCHSDLCHWVADSPSKNRTLPPPPLPCVLLCRPGES